MTLPASYYEPDWVDADDWDCDEDCDHDTECDWCNLPESHCACDYDY